MNKKNLKDLIFGICCLIVYLILYKGIVLFIKSRFDNISNPELWQLGLYAVMSIFLIVVLLKFNMINILRFDKKNFFKGLFVGGAMLMVSIVVTILFILNLDINNLVPVHTMIAVIILFLVGTGFTEEVVCRGILQNCCYKFFGNDTKKGIVLSCLFTGMIFGLSHLTNLFTNSNVMSVFGQTLLTMGMGFYFGSIYARSKSLWSVIFIHGFYDLALSLDSDMYLVHETSSSTLSPVMYIVFGLIMFTVFSLFALFNLRNKKINEAINI